MTLPLLVLTLLSASPERPKMIVLDLAPAGGVDLNVAAAITEALATDLARAGYFQVVSSKDVRTLIGLERERQLVGCSSDAQSCQAELAGALGAKFVLSGSVAQLGDAFQLSLQVLDSERAQSLGRTTRMAKDLKALRAAIPYALADATGTPPPPAPSRVLPFSLMGGGAAAILGGAVLALDGFARERETNRELELGRTNPEVLRPAEAYRATAAIVSAEKTIALVVAVAGAGLLGAGIYLNPREDGAAVALVPSASGLAIVGVFP